MTTWARSLDEYETTIVELERAAAAGEPPALPPWQPPTTPLETPPTEAERARLDQLQHRADACRTQLASTLFAASERIDAVRRTGAAARAYGRVEHLTGGASTITDGNP